MVNARADGQWYPPEWPERIRALAGGGLTPVTPKRAATVMLLKDTGGGPAVHMLRRRTSMAFAGGAYAYPCGGVDPLTASGRSEPPFLFPLRFPPSVNAIPASCEFSYITIVYFENPV